MPVVTSKPAQKDFNEIVAKHADILQGMTTQSQKIQEYNQQKNAIDAQKAAQDAQNQANGMKSRNEQVALAQKQEELNIKKMALTQP